MKKESVPQFDTRRNILLHINCFNKTQLPSTFSLIQVPIEINYVIFNFLLKN